MFGRSNKTSNHPPETGSRIARTLSESSLVDVTFSQQRPSQASTLKTAKPGERGQIRQTKAAASTTAKTELLPRADIGLSWASSGALKHAGMHRGLYRPLRSYHRRRWLWPMLIVTPLLLALTVGVRLLFTVPYFQIQHIMVEGTRNASLIAAIQRLHLNGGNIFLANTSADAAVIKTLPPVADANVTRMLPDTLLVHIIERQPVLIWQVGLQEYNIDAGGVIIAPVQQPDPLPVISDEHLSDLHGRPFAPGGHIDPAIVQMARQLLKELPAALGSSRFTLRDTIHYGLVLISADGWQARFGGPDDTESKIKELAAILQLVRQQGQQLALVDLRFGWYPYYRLKSPGDGP